MNPEWLFQPDDVIHMWSRGIGHWSGDLIVLGHRVEGSGFALYDVRPAQYIRWLGDTWRWCGAGMSKGIPREIVEDRCTFICVNDFERHREHSPIRPWWTADPSVFDHQFITRPRD